MKKKNVVTKDDLELNDVRGKIDFCFVCLT